MNHSLTTEQIEDIVNSDYSKEYFVWRIDEDNQDRFIENFFDAEIFDYIDEPIIALMQHTGEFYSDCESYLDNGGYLVCEEDKADKLAHETAEGYADDARMEIPKYLQRYFNDDLYIEELLDDGRGPLLNYYDGCEYEELVNGTTYYVYRN